MDGCMFARCQLLFANDLLTLSLPMLHAPPRSVYVRTHKKTATTTATTTPPSTSTTTSTSTSTSTAGLKFCDSFNCKPTKTWVQVEDASAVPCKNEKCRKAVCCTKTKTYCDSHQCNSKVWEYVESPATVICKNGKCSNKNCCVRKPLYCDSYSCDKAGYTAIPNAADSPCRIKSNGVYKCNLKTCCARA